MLKKSLQVLRNTLRKGLTSVMFNRYLSGLGPGSVAIDCGANVGDISFVLGKTGASVYAFEPNPYAYEALVKRVGDFANVTCLNKGVWDRNTTAPLYFHREAGDNEEFWSFASSIFSTKGNVDPSRSVETELIDLTAFIENLGQPVDLLKIDIEGAECEVLEKMIARNLHEKVKLTLVETHDRKIPGLKEKTDHVRALIREKGIDNIRLSWL